VKRGHENAAVRNAVLRSCQASSLPGSDSLEMLPPPLYPLCRDYYFEELARRAPSATVVTNTSPGHIHVAAFMMEAIGNVRFLFVKRDIEDNVLRIYMARYRGGNAYAYDLKAARDQVLRYNEMIDLMAEKFPDIVRVVRYEDMVLRPDAARSAAAELCRLTTSSKPLPAISNDSGCATPYRHFMNVEAAAAQPLAGIGKKISFP
jgi:sulfotransferase family protein